MRIIVLHGNNIEESRKRLQKFIDTARKRKWETVIIASGKDNVEELLSRNTLFGTQRLFILENPEKITKDVSNWLRENKDNDETLVVYSTKTLTKTFINSLGNIEKIELFEYPKLIWKFIDSFYPGNSKEAITLFHQTIEKEAAELVFALLSRQLRDLYQVLVDESSMAIPSWRLGKLKSQANKFGEDRLRDAISDFANFDIESKTSSINLTDLLDFMMMEKLE